LKILERFISNKSRNGFFVAAFILLLNTLIITTKCGRFAVSCSAFARWPALRYLCSVFVSKNTEIRYNRTTS